MLIFYFFYFFFFLVYLSYDINMNIISIKFFIFDLWGVIKDELRLINLVLRD